jgi:hypothetical protein
MTKTRVSTSLPSRILGHPLGLEFGILNIIICFEFRASNFEFFSKLY